MTHPITWPIPETHWKVQTEHGASYYDTEADARAEAIYKIKDGYTRIEITEEDED